MNKIFVITLCLVTLILLYFLSPILTPFLIGTLLAYLVNPIVILLMRMHLPRVVAVMIVFLILFFIMGLSILLVIPLIQTQIDHLIIAMPDFFAWVDNTAVPFIKARFGNHDIINMAALKAELSQNWMKAGGAAGWAVKTVLSSGMTILHWLLDIILIFVATFYLLYDWEKFLNGLHRLLPRKYEPVIMKLVKDCNQVIAAFFRGQLLVMLTLGVYYSIALTLIGLQFGLVIGIAVGLLSIIPYLGVIVGILSASIAAFIQYGTFVSIIPVLLVFAFGQTLDGMFITPKLVGDRIGLHPIAVIFAVLAGGTLFGFFGVLLALPVASIIMVLLRFLIAHYHNSPLYR